VQNSSAKESKTETYEDGSESYTKWDHIKWLQLSDHKH